MLLQDIQILSRHHLKAHPAKFVTARGLGCLLGEMQKSIAKKLRAPGQHHVANQYRTGNPEALLIAGIAVVRVQGFKSLVNCGLASPGVTLIQQVVVDQGSGMEHFQRCGNSDNGGVDTQVLK